MKKIYLLLIVCVACVATSCHTVYDARVMRANYDIRMNTPEKLEIKGKVRLFTSDAEIPGKYEVISYNIYNPFRIPLLLSRKYQYHKRFYDNAVRKAYKQGGNGVVIQSGGYYKVINIIDWDSDNAEAAEFVNSILDRTLLDIFASGDIKKMSPRQIGRYKRDMVNEIYYNLRAAMSSEEVKVIGEKIEALDNWNNSLQTPEKKLAKRLKVFKVVHGSLSKTIAKREAKQSKLQSAKAKDEARRSAATARQQAADNQKIAAQNAETQKEMDAINALFEMVYVEGGKFAMGATDGAQDAAPIHDVVVSDFYMSKYEITQAQWRAIMNEKPSCFKGDDYLPVENVSWDKVQKFIAKLNQKSGKTYRLPTEAEWEYAARGGRKSNGYKCSGSNNVDEVAWYYKNGGRKTHKVGQKQPNELGLYDMTGNVMEWCQDRYAGYDSAMQTTPTGPNDGSDRVARGGAYVTFENNLRLTNRESALPNSAFNFIGFRLVLEK